jgi:hypothetical protein
MGDFTGKLIFSVAAASVCLTMFSTEAVILFSVPFNLLGDVINLLKTPNFYVPFDSKFNNFSASIA